MTEEPQAYTVARAARELDRTPVTIYRYIRDGKLIPLPGVEGDIVKVTGDSVRQLKAEEEAGGS